MAGPLARSVPENEMSIAAGRARDASERKPLGHTVVFAFASFQGVIIKAIETKGFVFSRMANAHNENEYKVMYWMDGERKEGWFYEFELEAA